MVRETNFGTGHDKLRAMRDAEYPGGVVVDPMPITAGEEITIFYNGLLSQGGAREIYLRVGFGSAYDWQNTTETRMSRTNWGFVKTMEIPDKGRFNFCFRDNAYNWDNNYGHNWSFEIHNGNRH